MQTKKSRHNRDFFVIALANNHSKNIFAYPKKDIILHHLIIKCHFSSAGRATHS